MRLGGPYGAETTTELAPLCERLDRLGLSAIPAPKRLLEMPDEECEAFGRTAQHLDLVIGEAGMWRNLMTTDQAIRGSRIEITRTLLCKAELMNCRCVVGLVGTKHASDHPTAPYPEMFSDAAQAEFREIVLRILDGLDLNQTRFVIEPWCNTFFYQPETIADFIARVDHPRFGVHLDLMNMVNLDSFYETACLVERAFGRLRNHIASVHLKDIRWDYQHMFLKWDEVLIGDGVIDYTAYLTAIATQLPEDITCYCEHLADDHTYADNFARLHSHAEAAGLQFHRRAVQSHPILTS